MIWKLGIVLVIGYVLIGISMAFGQAAAAAGLEVGGMAAGVAGRPGHHLLAGPVRRAGRTVNTNRIPFWWDMVIVAVFSLVIFYWAMATKLPREEMMNLVERQGAEHVEPTALRGPAER